MRKTPIQYIEHNKLMIKTMLAKNWLWAIFLIHSTFYAALISRQNKHKNHAWYRSFFYHPLRVQMYLPLPLMFDEKTLSFHQPAFLYSINQCVKFPALCCPKQKATSLWIVCFQHHHLLLSSEYRPELYFRLIQS